MYAAQGYGSTQLLFDRFCDRKAIGAFVLDHGEKQDDFFKFSYMYPFQFSEFYFLPFCKINKNYFSDKDSGIFLTHL